MTTSTKRLLRDVWVPVLLLLLIALPKLLPERSAAVAIEGTERLLFGMETAVWLLVGITLSWTTVLRLLNRRVRHDMWPLAETTVIGYDLIRGVSVWWWLGWPAHGACTVVLQVTGRQVRVSVEELNDIQVPRPAGLRLKDVYTAGDTLIVEEARRRLPLGTPFPVRLNPVIPVRQSMPEAITCSEARAPSWRNLIPLVVGLVILGLVWGNLSIFIGEVVR